MFTSRYDSDTHSTGIDYTVDNTGSNSSYDQYSAHLFSGHAQNIICKLVTQSSAKGIQMYCDDTSYSFLVWCQTVARFQPNSFSSRANCAGDISTLTLYRVCWSSYLYILQISQRERFLCSQLLLFGFSNNDF